MGGEWAPVDGVADVVVAVVLRSLSASSASPTPEWRRWRRVPYSTCAASARHDGEFSRVLPTVTWWPSKLD